MSEFDRALIDGHNLIHAVDKYRAAAARNLREAMCMLLSDLSAAGSELAAKVTVVFDGHSPGLPRFPAVEVLFSKESSADDLLEKLATTRKPGFRVLLVSADVEQIRVAGGPGVTTIRPDFFAQRLSEAREEPPGTSLTRSPLEERVSESVRKRLEELRRGH